MTDYKNKDDNFKKLTRPIFAYITFRSDIAFHSVLELDKKEKEGDALAGGLEYRG